MEIKTTVTVEEDAIDHVGHVNNAVYVSYLEQGRGDWYAEAGLSFSQMVEVGVGTVLVKLEINFKKEALLGDTLTIATKPVKIGTKSFVLEQTVYNQNDEQLTEALATTVMFDIKERVGIPVIPEFAKHFPAK